ncbi:MAG TPA: hypothetical protein VKB68_18620, partial [Stellaceae bacterium]|nr:hypothetical protein [Stellaceae bacterium]
MATAAQIAANRRNALRSTGPRTVEGNAAAGRNALRHGLTARRHVVRGEDAESFDGLRAALRSALAPRDDREELLVAVVVQSAWRVRQAARAEAALFNRAGTLVLTDAQWAELAAIQRYEVAADRSFHCALAMLERGRIATLTAAALSCRDNRLEKIDFAKRSQFSDIAQASNSLACLAPWRFKARAWVTSKSRLLPWNDRNIVGKPGFSEPHRAQDSARTFQPLERPQGLGIGDIEIVDAAESGAAQSRESVRGHPSDILARLDPRRHL